MIGQNILNKSIPEMMEILRDLFVTVGAWLGPYFDQVVQFASSGGIGGAVLIGLIIGIFLRGIILKAVFILSMICIFFVLKDMGYIK